jgi:succinate dehydrogenase/fumarate reductase cytochrome b subunit
MNFGNHGLWGILVLIADIWAIINIAQSSASNGKKVLWIVLVLLLPVVGVIVWFFIGPRGGRA